MFQTKDNIWKEGDGMAFRKNTITVVLSLIAGMVGGMISTWLFVGDSVLAQKAPQDRLIQAGGIELLDYQGKKRVLIGITGPEDKAHFGFLSIKDEAGRERFGIGVSGVGDTMMQLSNSTGKDQVQLACRADGSPAFIMKDTQSEKQISMGVLNGTPVLTVSDPKGVARGLLGYFPEAEKRPEGPGLVFNDERGKDIWSAP